MSLDLTPGHGNLLGESYWELHSPSLGGSLTLNTGPAPRSAENVSSLSQILEDSPPRKYYLSRKACLGILRRARERGKPLPPQLEAALKAQAELTVCLAPVQNTSAYAAGVVSKGNGDCFLTPEQHTALSTGGGQAGQGYPCILTNVSPAANGDEAKPENVTFSAGFCAGAGPSAGSIGYQEEVAPTLKAAASGNMMPTVLCLNDQGGQIMDVSENVTGTLRAQEHSHQPLVLYENHGIDARYTGPHDVSPTIPARAGTGGNNLPLVGVELYERQRCDSFRASGTASTQSGRQHKDATDLLCQPNDHPPLLIRRLMPVECEKLMGYPPGWTDLRGARDAPRYKALGNSVVIPCVEYLMQGIALAIRAGIR